MRATLFTWVPATALTLPFRSARRRPRAPRACSRKNSISSSVPTVTRAQPGMPSALPSRRITPWASNSLAHLVLRHAQTLDADQHEVRLGGHRRPAALREPVDHQPPQARVGLAPQGHLVLVLEGLDRRELTQKIDVERLAHLVQRLPDLGRADAQAGAQAAQPVDLGERAQHDHVVVVPLDVQRVVAVGRRDELDVRLVDDHHHVVRHRLDQPPDLRGGHVGARRVVGVADEHELGLRRDRGGHGLEVVGEVPDGDRDRHRAADVDDVPVARERRRGEDDLVAALEHRLREQEQELAGAAADGDLLGVAAVVRGRRDPQVGREPVRDTAATCRARAAMTSLTSGNGGSGNSLEASLTTWSRPYLRCTASIGSPGWYGTMPASSGMNRTVMRSLRGCLR